MTSMAEVGISSVDRETTRYASGALTIRREAVYLSSSPLFRDSTGHVRIRWPIQISGRESRGEVCTPYTTTSSALCPGAISPLRNLTSRRAIEGNGQVVDGVYKKGSTKFLSRLIPGRADVGKQTAIRRTLGSRQESVKVKDCLTRSSRSKSSPSDGMSKLTRPEKRGLVQRHGGLGSCLKPHTGETSIWKKD